jgi:hypothetical protein
MAAYRMTAARKAALRKAQAASARKRRGKGRGKLAKANRSASRNKRIAIVAATGGLALAATGVAGAYYAKKTASGGPVRRDTVASVKQRAKRNGAAAGLVYSKKGSRVVGSNNKRTILRNKRRKAFTGDQGIYGKGKRKPSTGSQGIYGKGTRKPFTGDPGFYGRFIGLLK